MPPVREGLLLLLLSTILATSIAAPPCTRIGIPVDSEDQPASAILDWTNKPPSHDPIDWPIPVAPPKRHLGLDEQADSDASGLLEQAALTRTKKSYTTDTPYLPIVVLPPKRDPELSPAADNDQAGQSTFEVLPRTKKPSKSEPGHWPIYTGIPIPTRRDPDSTPHIDEVQGEQPSSVDHDTIELRWFEVPRTQAWPNATLRLKFADIKASEALHERVYEALQLWKLRAPFMTFHKLPTSPELSKDTTTIILDSSHEGACSSTVGFVPNGTINLDQDATVNVIAHEFGHSIGLFHEHQRPDRDQYISIQCWNVNPMCSTMPKGKSCCDKRVGSTPSLPDECCNVMASDFDVYAQPANWSKPYDAQSIMHYNSRTYSKWFDIEFWHWPTDIRTNASASPEIWVPMTLSEPTELDGEGVCHLYPMECNNNFATSQERAIPDRIVEDIESDIDRLYPVGRRPGAESCEDHQCPISCSTLQPCRSGRMCIHNPDDPSGPLVEKNTTCLAKMSECMDLGCGADGSRLLRRVSFEDEYIL